MPNDDRTDVIRFVAHDLRNPLTAIHLNAQLIERAAERDGRANERRWATLITGATRRLDDMIGQLVEAERLRSGQLQPTLAQVAWDEVLRESLTHVAPIPGSGEERLRLVLPAEPVLVSADRERLGRAMRILARLTAQGADGASQLVIELTVKDDQACCALLGVAPAGTGEAAVEPAGPRVAAEPGHGIALHFARTLIDVLGGQLRVTAGDPRSVGFEVVLATATSSRT